MRSAAAAIFLAIVLAWSSSASAQVIDGDNAAQVITLTIGTFAGLTNSVATIVYAVQNKSFDHGWVISSFVAGAICGAFAVGLTIESADQSDGLLMAPAIGYFVVGLVPAAWAIRGALSEVNPGERFDRAEAATAPVAVTDPFRRARAPAASGAWIVGLPAVRF